MREREGPCLSSDAGIRLKGVPRSACSPPEWPPLLPAPLSSFISAVLPPGRSLAPPALLPPSSALLPVQRSPDGGYPPRRSALPGELPSPLGGQLYGGPFRLPPRLMAYSTSSSSARESQGSAPPRRGPLGSANRGPFTAEPIGPTSVIQFPDSFPFAFLSFLSLTDRLSPPSSAAPRSGLL